MKEFKVGRLVRIKKFAENNPTGFGHKLRDVGVINSVYNLPDRASIICVVVPGRVSTSGAAPGVNYKEEDLILL